MSHIHIPDGQLPLWLCILGYLLTAIYIFVFGRHLKAKSSGKMALTGIIAALMLVSMSIEIMPISYHVNLAALAGIMLGPVLSVIAIFISNLMMAFMGHGGITVAGINTSIVSIEAISAFYLFKLFKNHISNCCLRTFISVFFSLLISTAVMAGTLFVSLHDVPLECLEHHHDKAHAAEHHDKSAQDEAHDKFNIQRFITLLFLFGIIGWLTESTISAFIVNYIMKIKPEIINENN